MVPRVTDFSQFHIMGVALSTRTTKTELTWGYRKKLPSVERSQWVILNPELFLDTGWAACIIATISLRKTTRSFSISECP